MLLVCCLYSCWVCSLLFTVVEIRLLFCVKNTLTSIIRRTLEAGNVQEASHKE